jgi:hypothetical protein
MEVQVYILLTCSEWSAHWRGGQVGPRVYLNAIAKKKISVPAKDWTIFKICNCEPIYLYDMFKILVSLLVQNIWFIVV